MYQTDLPYLSHCHLIRHLYQFSTRGKLWHQVYQKYGLRLGWCADSQLFFTCYGKDSRISVGRYSPAVLPVRHSPSHDAGYAAGEFVGTESQQ